MYISLHLWGHHSFLVMTAILKSHIIDTIDWNISMNMINKLSDLRI